MGEGKEKEISSGEIDGLQVRALVDIDGGELIIVVNGRRITFTAAGAVADPAMAKEERMVALKMLLGFSGGPRPRKRRPKRTPAEEEAIRREMNELAVHLARETLARRAGNSHV
jgi:hypothetical protein